MMKFSAPLGPATRARRDLCRPDEQLLWAAGGRVFYYEVEGLDPLGAPARGALRRGLGGVGKFAGDVVGSAVSEAVFGNVDQSSDKPPSPDVLAFGPRPGCLAHRYLSRLEPVGGTGRLWALTSHRLIVSALRPEPEQPQPAAEPEKASLLGKATRFGVGLARFGKDIAQIVADNRMRYGDHTEGVPVTAPALVAEGEVPRAEIAGFAIAERRAKVRSASCLRMSLVDGSGLDFLFDRGNRETCERVLALTHGGA